MESGEEEEETDRREDLDRAKNKTKLVVKECGGGRCEAEPLLQEEEYEVVGAVVVMRGD